MQFLLLSFVYVGVMIRCETNGCLPNIAGEYDIIAVVFILKEEVEVVAF
jgi:hypothetical protein